MGSLVVDNPPQDTLASYLSLAQDMLDVKPGVAPVGQAAHCGDETAAAQHSNCGQPRDQVDGESPGWYGVTWPTDDQGRKRDSRAEE